VRTASLRQLRAFGFYTEPADAPHFAMTRDEPVTIYITGFGPTDTDYIDAAADPHQYLIPAVQIGSKVVHDKRCHHRRPYDHEADNPGMWMPLVQSVDQPGEASGRRSDRARAPGTSLRGRADCRGTQRDHAQRRRCGAGGERLPFLHDGPRQQRSINRIYVSRPAQAQRVVGQPAPVVELHQMRDRSQGPAGPWRRRQALAGLSRGELITPEATERAFEASIQENRMPLLSNCLGRSCNGWNNPNDTFASHQIGYE
jgi:hypothetical protein